jgi:hypothetical protein
MEISALILAVAVSNHTVAQANVDLGQRCTQLVAFFDRYGASRSANSDGRRNHTRICAEIACQRGNYQKGIAMMEELLRNKAFSVPPPAPPVSVPPVESPEYG